MSTPRWVCNQRQKDFRELSESMPRLETRNNPATATSPRLRAGKRKTSGAGEIPRMTVGIPYQNRTAQKAKQKQKQNMHGYRHLCALPTYL